MSAKYRIALCGANATGKSSLAVALAQDMKVPHVPEDLSQVVTAMNAANRARALGDGAQQEALQHYLEACQQWLNKRAKFLREHKEGFVADRWAMDILVRWLFSGVAYDNDALYRRLVGHVGRIAQQLDAVVVLPLMDLAPQEATNESGLHRHHHWSRRLHEQALLRGLLDLHVPCMKIYVPARPMSVADRTVLVLEALRKPRS